ncbi:hypothetical protein HD806DRAFT_478083 [Xylariaceae sp. AK1471]|nr:hypothetical protein HD806DRAFT_478083 [Xylariaceae sp. AK1471]
MSVSKTYIVSVGSILVLQVWSKANKSIALIWNHRLRGVGLTNKPVGLRGCLERSVEWPNCNHLRCIGTDSERERVAV